MDEGGLDRTNLFVEEEEDEEDEAVAAPSMDGSLMEAGKIDDLMGDDLKLFKRKVYLIIVSSMSFEECAHKLIKSDIPEQYERELCKMIVECCAQEKRTVDFMGCSDNGFASFGRCIGLS